MQCFLLISLTLINKLFHHHQTHHQGVVWGEGRMYSSWEGGLIVVEPASVSMNLSPLVISCCLEVSRGGRQPGRNRGEVMTDGLESREITETQTFSVNENGIEKWVTCKQVLLNRFLFFEYFKKVQWDTNYSNAKDSLKKKRNFNWKKNSPDSQTDLTLFFDYTSRQNNNRS